MHMHMHSHLTYTFNNAVILYISVFFPYKTVSLDTNGAEILHSGVTEEKKENLLQELKTKFVQILSRKSVFSGKKVLDLGFQILHISFGFGH